MARRRSPDDTQGFDALAADRAESAASPDPALVAARRRFVRRRWARRWLAWKPVVALLLVLALIGGGAWLVLGSSYLAVDDVRVDGAQQLSATEIERAAGVPLGEPLARVDLTRIRTRVEALAPVRSADVARQWPNTVLITVEEREAVALVDLGGRIQGLDEEGVVFRGYSRPPDLPRIQSAAGTGSEALREGALVAAALPGDLAGRIDHIDVDTVDQITLELRDGREVRWGSAEESTIKAKVLAELLATVRAERYDVTVPGQPATTGSADG